MSGAGMGWPPEKGKIPLPCPGMTTTRQFWLNCSSGAKERIKPKQEKEPSITAPFESFLFIMAFGLLRSYRKGGSKCSVPSTLELLATLGVRFVVHACCSK
eukprot:2756301-Amphidinium_carterae.1